MTKRIVPYQYAGGGGGKLNGETFANFWRLTRIRRIGDLGAVGGLGADAAACAMAAVWANLLIAGDPI